MIFKATLIWDINDDEKERKLELTTREFVYMIKHCKNLNEVSAFINLILEKREEI